MEQILTEQTPNKHQNAYQDGRKNIVPKRHLGEAHQAASTGKTRQPGALSISLRAERQIFKPD